MILVIIVKINYNKNYDNNISKKTFYYNNYYFFSPFFLFIYLLFLVVLLYFIHKNRDSYIVCKFYNSYLLEIF